MSKAQLPPPPPQSKQSYNLQQAIELYDLIHQSLDIRKSLVWNQSIEALKAALMNIEAQETKRFLDQYLLQVITLMTQQNPAKMGNFERGVMEDTIITVLNIMLRIVAKNPHHLATLSRLFDPLIPYYGGTKVGYNFVPGFPNVRIHMAKRFADAKGFAVVAEALSNQHCQWPGSHVIIILLRSIIMNENSISDEVRISIVAAVQSMLLKLPDDTLKRENTDVLGSIIHIMGKMVSSIRYKEADLNCLERFHTFWFEHTLKLLQSGSLVVKLFAWDQLIEIINDARLTRPLASSYVVSGAGTSFVNGEYKMIRRNYGQNESMQYTLQTSEPTAPILTLFRCTMRNKSKWWFISKADLEKPGTDKDIDYYLHKSGPEEEREPPSKGWTKSNSGMTLIGADPSPTLRRKGLILPVEGRAEDFLDAQLIKWCASNDLLGSVFGVGSVHREIVARSSKLLVFLAEYEALNAEHLAAIWKSALQTNENDIADEIFGLLVQMSSVIMDEMFEGLINMALEALVNDENAQKIASFAEKFTMDGYHHVNQMLSDQSVSKLISLVWELYKKPYFESLKNSTILQDLLSNCFSHSNSPNLVTHRILECKQSLTDLNDGTANSSFNENDVSRMIHMLHFLVAKHTSEEMIANLDEQGFAQCIITEIERFVSDTRPKFQNGTIDELKYSQSLSDRLRILRRFYGIHSKVSIPLKSIEKLSKLLSANACEIDQFFLFLKSNAQSSNAAMVSVEDALSIFKNIICNPQIDWRECGDGAFQCFRAYFTELEASATFLPAGTELPPQLGLETLWRIALNAKASFSVDAIALLLEAYETLLFRDDSAYNGMLKILFGHLEEAASTSKLISSDTRDKVSRCVSILNSALAKSRGTAGVAHVLRGVMFRIKVNVFYRRVNGFFNPTTQSEVMRVEKGSEGIMNLEMHPFHSIKHLKELIATKLGYSESSISINIDRHNKSMLSDTTRISELNLSDGDELSVSYQITFKQFGYTQDRISNGDEDRLMHVGQLIANDYSKFDILLTLCEVAEDENMKQELWQLIMLIPSQVDLVEQIKEQICYPESSSSVPLTPGKSNANWNQIIRNASSTRSTYLLQIIDNMLQPALELSDSLPSVNSVLNERIDDQREDNENEGLQSIESAQFRKDLVAINGFQLILEKFIEIPSDENENIINSTASAVALHIIHFLAFGHRRSTDQSSILPVTTATALDLTDDSIDVIRPGDTVSIASVIHATGENTDCVEDFQWVEKAESLLAHIEGETATKLLNKLLYVARNAAARGDSGVVENALMVVTELLIKVPVTAGQLARNPQSESLLSTVLRSKSKKVRENASEFAIQVGRSQPIVFTWLLNEFNKMNPRDEDCSEIFSSLNTLLGDLQLSTDKHICTSQCNDLGEILSKNLASYPRGKMPIQQERYVLLGMLELLENLLLHRPEAYLTYQSSDSLVKSFLSEFLFTLPTMDGSRDDNAPLCDTPVTRAAAFKVLAALIGNSMEAFELVLQELSRLTSLAAQRMRNSWGLQVSYAVKKPDMNFSGLKNQGCTCYMNSLLQVLFMNDAFREAVLQTPLLESHRNTLWHRSEVELVGQQLLFEWANGSWQRGQVVGFDPQTSQHRVQYMNDDGSPIDSIVAFPLHDGRIGKETGRIKLLSSINGSQSNEGSYFLVEVLEDEEPVTERESAAYQVLDQLQRAFCHMKLSQRRFYDPRPFVDACKTLNLNFNVYHQNDAAEFYDQLLDRLETATKGKHSKVKMWDKVFMKNVFGGKWLYQKIPRDCGTFDSNRANCGHWQGSREESYLKVEILIRGKENIEESLDDFIQGELMDGDNKINCDVCMEKKATVRRTCFDSLPNTLMLHLKRFDLDFQTFETVKLNNRMTFPTRINMFKYTKEGIEVQERKEQQDSKDSDGNEKVIDYDHTPNEEVNCDIAEYIYELQGVLVHAGVAQGGHYYSFIKDPKSDQLKKSVSNDDSVSFEAGDLEGEHWYKFDDDEVLPFDPQYIPLQCFGGPYSAYANDNGANSGHNDEDRTSNALMLVYSKVKKTPDSDESKISSVCEQLKKDSTVSQNTSNKKKRLVRIVDGMEAYEREVRESNLHHVLSCFLVDPDLHTFIRGLIASIASHTEADDDANLTSDFGVASRRYDDVHSIPTYDLQWSPNNAVDDLPLRTVQFGCSFLLDVVMHCRERAAIRASVYVLRKLFETHPHTAYWFVCHIVDTSVCTWLHSFLLNSTDALARAAFVQIVVHAVSVIAPKDTYSIDRFRSQNSGQLMAAAANDKDPAVKVALLLRMLLDCIFSSVVHVRTADELFVLIRDLAAIPSVCYALQGLGTVGFLSFFTMPDTVPEIVRKLFFKKMSNSNVTGLRSMDYANLHQSVLEAMAALLGVPQLRKVSLLQERSYWETELVPDAKDALTTIFYEVSRNGGMDANDITRYFERVGGGTSSNPNHRITAIQVRNILDRFPTSSDGRLNLDGFLQYHADAASYNPKNVWRDLHAFGFRNDLSRAPKPRNSGAGSLVVTVVEESKDMDSVPVDTEDEVLNINENDKHCLANLQLYEAGLSASEASTRAIAKRVCYKDEEMSRLLIRQALSKLAAVARENSWNNHTLGVIIDFICLLLGIEDEFQSIRLGEVMLHPQWGMAVIADSESTNPSPNVRANNGFNQFSLFERYIGFVQNICQVPGIKGGLDKLAETDGQVKFVRGQLKLRPGIDLTEDEYFIVSNTAIVVQGGGVSEANGRYTFSDIKCNAGYYSLRSNYGGKPACFTVYKCSMRNGGHQWFLSITPEGMEPGSNDDIDFYYALSKQNDILPPDVWLKMNNHMSKDPIPRVYLLRPEVAKTKRISGRIGDSSSLEHQRHLQLPHDQIDQDSGILESSDSDLENYIPHGGSGIDESLVNSELNDTMNSNFSDSMYE